LKNGVFGAKLPKTPGKLAKTQAPFPWLKIHAATVAGGFPVDSPGKAEGNSRPLRAGLSARGVAPGIHYADNAAPKRRLDLCTSRSVRQIRSQGKLGAELVMDDRDTKFSAKFDSRPQCGRLHVQKSSFRSPNRTAFAEGLIQTLQQNCLSHFIVFGEQHLNHL
jgi:hypothetical protein